MLLYLYGVVLDKDAFPVINVYLFLIDFLAINSSIFLII